MALASRLYARDHAALVAVEHYTAEHGYAPSFREIAVAAGLSSISQVRLALESLERQGYVELPPKGRTRSIIVRRPSCELESPRPGREELIAEAKALLRLAWEYDGQGMSLDVAWLTRYADWKLAGGEDL